MSRSGIATKRQGGERIRVLIAEDSPTSRALLVALFRTSPDFDVVAEAANGAEAIEHAVRLAPDLIIMDVYMPLVDGVDATKEIMRERPTPIVMISASKSVSDVSLGLSATEAGALVLLEKPHDPGSPEFQDDCEQLLATSRMMADVKVVRRWRNPRTLDASHSPAASAAPDSRREFRLIAIGTSTGGPAALHRILLDLPGDLSVPIVVVQHMAPGFIGGLASWLGASVAPKVVVATDNEPLVAGTVYLAPDDHHLGVKAGGVIALTSTAPVGGFRPAASHLFHSSAAAYGSALIAVILTGMGQDGVAGLASVRERGGRILAQDEKSSVVFGMPREAVRSGVVDEVIALDAIGRRLGELVGGRPQ